MNMRETIAERLMRHYVEGGSWDGFMEADIVLDALMEPTEGMEDAYYDAHASSSGVIATPKEAFQAMIRAAKEGK